MADTAIAQVEDRLKTIIDAYAPLNTHTVMVADSLDIAIEDVQLPAIIISTRNYSFDVADEHWNTFHTATIEVEAVQALPATGTISRANMTALAYVLAAIAADRTLGIKVHDIQETDIAPVEPRGKDVDSASLQFTVQFFTSRDDWFTII